MENICSHKAVKAMALLFLSFAFSASAETWWVAEDGNDDATGSESAPFASLSRALERASAEGRDVIRIKDGTYVSTGAVLVDKPVEIIGNDADRSKVTIDGEQKNSLLGICHLEAFVHGITFTRGGNGTDVSIVTGARPSYFGCNFEMTDGILSNCTVKAGYSQFAGCLSFPNGAPTVVDCWIEGGRMSSSGELGCRGGGVKMAGSSRLIGCVVTNCNSKLGGGVYMTGLSQVIGCVIEGNVSRATGAETVAAGIYQGGGVISNCVIRNNLDDKGAPARGVYMFDGGTLCNTLVTGHAAERGGGVYMNNGAIVNCTVAGNTATASGSGVYMANGTLLNTAVGAMGEMDAIRVEGGLASHSCGTGLTTGENGNFGVSPQFRDETNDDYRLLGSSPCIDAGVDLIWHDGASDVSGVTARVLDGNKDDVAVVDIGAYEYDPSDVPPGVSFSAVMSPGGVFPRMVTFTPSLEGVSDEDVCSSVWFFGDGTSVTNETLRDVQHGYAEAGYYTVMLEVVTRQSGTLTSCVADAVKIKPNVVYMSTTGSATAPYDRPSRGTPSIQDALMAVEVPAGGRARIVVADGVYAAPEYRVALETAIEIVGNDADPSAVTFDGKGSHPFFLVNDPNVIVHGVQFKQGMTDSSRRYDLDGPDYSYSVFEVRLGCVSNCVFRENRGTFGVMSAWKSGVVLNSLFENNAVTSTGEAGHGGGLKAYGESVCRGCVFTNNSARYGGAISVNGASTLVENCRFYGNKATAIDGGAVYQVNGILRGALIAGNEALAKGAKGGGLAQVGGTAVNLTVADNQAPQAAGAAIAGTLVNSIVLGSGDYDPLDPPLVSAGTIRRCCSPSLADDDCLSEDPAFVNRLAGDYKLRASSKCIGFGDNSAWPNGKSAVDLSGDVRIRGRIDLGCYESRGRGLVILIY